jgi:3-isopropylmalate dehydrogenase
LRDYRISVIPGDGIGPEQIEATMSVLEAVQDKFEFELKTIMVEAGDACFERTGTPLPVDTIEAIESSDACLKAPVGETAADVIVKLRRMFDLYANIRPVKTYPNVSTRYSDIDITIVRENTEGVYRGIEFAVDEGTTMCMRVITKKGSERIARYAFELARQRNKSLKVTSVHKANVMKLTCGLFAKTCREVAKDFPDVELNELYVDAAAMQLIKNPNNFDVIVTTNMFGDILSDEASMLVGGLGMAPGANIGDKYAIFEPVHGSAPKYAGKQIANPCSMILAAKMMLNWLGEKYDDDRLKVSSKSIEEAMIKTLGEGVRTRDIGGNAKTREVGEEIAKKVKEVKM